MIGAELVTVIIPQRSYHRHSLTANVTEIPLSVVHGVEWLGRFRPCATAAPDPLALHADPPAFFPYVVFDRLRERGGEAAMPTATRDPGGSMGASGVAS